MLGPLTFRAGAKKPLNQVIFSNLGHSTSNILVANKTAGAGVTIRLLKNVETGTVSVGEIALGGSESAIFSVGTDCDQVVASGVNRDGSLVISVTYET
jgi:hypothetical protein